MCIKWESVVELQRGGKIEKHQLILPYLEFLIASETRELPKLQLNTGHLCHSAVRCPARRMCSAPANVDIRIWYLGGGLECWHKPVSDVFLKKTKKNQDKTTNEQIHTHPLLDLLSPSRAKKREQQLSFIRYKKAKNWKGSWISS